MLLQLRYTWTQETCVALNPHGSTLNIVSTLVTDVGLLFIMLIGLVRLRSHRSSAFGLGHLLWKQVWFSMFASLSIHTYFPFVRALFGSSLPALRRSRQ